jgi:putative phosphoribosyl transferase
MRSPIDTQEVNVGPLGLPGELVCPQQARGLVVFAHGSGSSRSSPRNRYVAQVLNQHRLSTLLFDLLTDEEAAERRNVFDIALLAQRVVAALEWLCEPGALRDECGPRLGSGMRRVGLFGASTGAAAALQAAAERPARVSALVSRGGRGDLAAPHLRHVQAPTLLLVGGADSEVLQLNRQVLRELRCEKRLEIVPGATHLFDEPGALDAVAHMAGDWFARHSAQGPLLQ